MNYLKSLQNKLESIWIPRGVFLDLNQHEPEVNDKSVGTNEEETEETTFVRKPSHPIFGVVKRFLSKATITTEDKKVGTDDDFEEIVILDEGLEIPYEPKIMIDKNVGTEDDDVYDETPFPVHIEQLDERIGKKRRKKDKKKIIPTDSMITDSLFTIGGPSELLNNFSSKVLSKHGRKWSHKRMFRGSKRSFLHKDSVLGRSRFSLIFEEDLEIKMDFKTNRQEFLRILKQKTSLLDKFKKFLAKVSKHGSAPNEMFTYWEFIMMLLFFEMNVGQIMAMGVLFVRYGIIVSSIVMVVLNIFINMPITMYVISLSSYSRKMCLQFFECAPLFKGLSYTLLGVFIFSEAQRIFYIEASIRYVAYILYDYKWKYCERLYRNPACVPINTTEKHNKECVLTHTETNLTEYFATQYFVRHVLFEIYRSQDGIYSPIHADKLWVGIVTCTSWIIVTSIAINGFNNIKKVAVKMQLALFIPIFVILVMILVSRFTVIEVFSAVYLPWYKIIEPRFMFKMISTMLKPQQLPFLLWISVHKPANANPQGAAIITCVLHSLSIMLYACCYGISVLNISQNYNFFNFACIYISSRDIIFSLIPDFLMRLNFSKVWLLCWNIPIMFYLIMYSVFAILVVVDTFIQAVPKALKIRIPVTICVSIIFFTLHSLNYFTIYFISCYNLEYGGLGISNNIHISLFIFGIYFLYSPIRFKDDFLFTYSRTPSPFWTSLWVFIPYFSMMVGVFLIYFITYQFSTEYLQSIHVGIGITLLVVLVICTFLFIRLCSMLMFKRHQYITSPDPNWGPYDLSKKELRNNYFSQRDVKVRHSNSQITCKHKCLLQLMAYRNMRTEQYEKLCGYPKLLIFQLKGQENLIQGSNITSKRINQ